MHAQKAKNIARLIALTVVVFSLSLQSGLAQSQKNLEVDSVQVRFALKNAPLREALQKLITQSGLQIVYNDALVNGLLVSCECKNVSVRQALDSLLADTPLSYQRLKNGQVVIIKKQPDKKVDLSGTVRDGFSGETLPYANISVLGQNHGTASNSNGYFVLVNVPAGSCTLRVRYIGYETLNLPLQVGVDAPTLDIALNSQALEGQEVLVTADNNQSVEVTDEPAEIRLSPRQISAMPSIGEVDIFRSLQMLPGISGVSDGSSGLYIRGGTPEQNLILFDGMTIYHVDHFFGFVSAFNTEAVKDVRVFKGGFPASFGGRTSGVVELTGKSGSFDRFNARGSVNLLSGSAVVQVPVAGRGSWLLSFRRSYTDLIKSGLYTDIYQTITGQNRSAPSSSIRASLQNSFAGNPSFTPRTETITPDFFYFDLNSKFSYALSAEDVLALSFYQASDNLDQTQSISNVQAGMPGNDRFNDRLVVADQTEWGNIGGSAKWSRSWGERLYTNLLGAYTRYESLSSQGIAAELSDPNAVRQNYSSSENNRISDFTLRFDTEWQVSRNHRFEFGSWFANTNVQVGFFANDSVSILSRDKRATQAAFYFQDKWQVLAPLEMTVGLRSTNYSLTATNYLEPRAALRLSLGKNLWLKGAWGQYYQFITRVVNEDVLQGNRDFWLLADQQLDPGYAEHSIAGLTYETGDYLFDVEAYSKDLDGVAEFSPRFQLAPQDRQTPLFFLGSGTARGIELFAQKKKGALNGWASYTLAKVENRFAAYNNGDAFPADQDRRHEVKLFGGYQFGKWRLAATWVYATGTPYTAPEAQYAIGLLDGSSRSFIHVGDKNSQRLPDYHRLDVSLTRTFASRNLSWEAGLSIFNLYNRANVWYREYFMQASPAIVRDVTTLGFTPTLTLSVGLR